MQIEQLKKERDEMQKALVCIRKELMLVAVLLLDQQAENLGISREDRPSYVRAQLLEKLTAALAEAKGGQQCPSQ